jgi:integrase
VGDNRRAQRLLHAGVDLKVISARLGHAGISITADTYISIPGGLEAEAANKIDQALRAAARTVKG